MITEWTVLATEPLDSKDMIMFLPGVSDAWRLIFVVCRQKKAATLHHSAVDAHPHCQLQIHNKSSSPQMRGEGSSDWE